MERKMSEKLLDWKNRDGRKPFLLYGARQVGKTYTVLCFGKEHYKNTVYFNLDGDVILQRIFDRDLNPERIIQELASRSGQNIFKEDTLVFLDEIQCCAKALASLKHFCEEAPGYHVIAASSLTSVEPTNQKFPFPVGKIEIETLYPLDFEEFLWTLHGKAFSGLIRESYNNNRKFSQHQIGLDTYRKYLVIGGMPAAINEYMSKNDYNFVASTQKTILNAYVAEMVKYAKPNETPKIMAAFDSIPGQLAKENRKFQYSIIKMKARAFDYEGPLDWLQASGLVSKCNKVLKGKSPLSDFADSASFKVYMMDVGLLCQRFGLPLNTVLLESNAYENFTSALTENYVAAALSMSGHSLYYWKSGGTAEVDFVIQTNDGTIVAIEIKSSGDGRSKSLTEFVESYKPPYSIRVSTRNFSFINKIKAVPLYAVFCIS